MKRELKKAFMSGVDGASGNLFTSIRQNLASLSLINGVNYKKTITIGELYYILCDVEEKQDKEISKYINQ